MTVIQAASKSETSAADLAELIEADPHLLAHIMRLANSAYYGHKRNIRSIQQAIVVVGFRTVSTVASVTAANLRGTGDIPPDFWEHSAATAIASREIAERLGASSDTAFAAGILHDLGLALLYQIDPLPYGARPFTRPQPPEHLKNIEVAQFGMDHAEAASLVLTAWQLPKDIVDAVAQHHNLMAVDPLHRAVVAGNLLAEEGFNPGALGQIQGAERYILQSALVDADEIHVLAERIVTEATTLYEGLAR